MPHRALASALLLTLAGAANAGSFTYRGQLAEDGVPAKGRYDLQFQLYADAAGTRPLGAPIEVREVTVSDGAFAAALELPESLASSAWLEVAVRPVGEFAWWPLGEKEAVSLKASVCPAGWELGGNAGTLSTTNFLGTVDDQALVLRSNNQPVARFRSVQLSANEIGANIVLGSASNTANGAARGVTIGGGGQTSAPNEVHDLFTTVAGGAANIAGTDNPDAEDAAGATVSGGTINRASGAVSTVAGGNRNVASGGVSTISGGANHDATGIGATIAGGNSNKASALFSTVSGGGDNRAGGSGATVAGGTSNRAQGEAAFVAGGSFNCAGAAHSWAGGRRAAVRPDSGALDAACNGVTGVAGGDVGSFVWADSQDLGFVSGGADQFLIRARGGVSINGTPIADAVELSVVADADDSDFANLFLRQRSNNAGILFSSGGASSTPDNNAGFFIDHFNGAGGQARRLALNSDGSVLIRSNISAANTGVTMAAGSGAWSALSDRNVKTAIVAVDPVAVLDRLLVMPISEWSYTAQGEGIRHLGPMAQDFAAAFGLGENATTISSIDADGVALAAIQGLNAKLERENAALRTRVDSLAAEMAALRRAVATLQAAGEH